ncbi:hypothetical protein INR49_014679, partial [Caranx melampygus]
MLMVQPSAHPTELHPPHHHPPPSHLPSSSSSVRREEQHVPLAGFIADTSLIEARRSGALFRAAAAVAAAAAVVVAVVASLSNCFGCNEFQCRELTLAACIQSERERETLRCTWME